MTTQHETPPVLLLAFCRPDTTLKVFNAIRQARPKRFFFAVDAPRPEKGEEETKRCEQVKALAKLVDWDCEFHTLFREKNLGCKYGPCTAYDWFFSQVEYGIVLEDDCVPTQSFFPFCAELLEKYKNEPRIGMISGNNHYGFQTRKNCSYHFSVHGLIWGWASWARAWKLNDVTLERYMKDFDSIRNRTGFTRRYRDTWIKGVRTAIAGNSAWDYQWEFAKYANSLLTIRPRSNMVSNIGFGEHATHTQESSYKEIYVNTQDVKFPLVHPSKIEPDKKTDVKLERKLFASLPARAWRKLLRKLGVCK